MGTQLPSPKGAQPPSNFRPMSIVAKRLDGSTFTQRTLTCGELTSADVSSRVTVCGWLRHSGLFLLLRDAYGMVQAVVSNPEGPSSPVTWHGGKPRSRPHCARWGPSFSPPKKGHSPQIFNPCLLWPNGWMDQDATWYEGTLKPGNIVLDADLAPPRRGTAPHFRPMTVVVKWLDGSRCHLV